MAVVVKKFGWSGFATIAGTQVLVTSGSFTEEATPGTITMISIPNNNESRSKVLYADGTEITNGSIGFDVSVSSMSLISTSRLLMRGYKFNVVLHDGEQGFTVEDCFVSSVSVSGSVGGLLSASVSFLSKEKFGAGGGGSYMRDEQPYGYWYSGDASVPVRDWTLNFNQEVQPMYLNQDSKTAKYLRVGLIEASLETTTFERVTDKNDIVIASSSFVLKGVTNSSGYSFNGQSDIGTFSHSFVTAASLSIGSGDQIIS
jgi:hypothetical protein